MHVIHGTWIPAATAEFFQGGAFYLWVEADSAVVHDPPPDGGDQHPRHLGRAELAAFLADRLEMRALSGGVVDDLCAPQQFLLPSAGGVPLPSFELLHYVDEQAPEQFSLDRWAIWCCRLPRPVVQLNDIHFRVLAGVPEVQLGTDLLFWQRFMQTLKGLLLRDQYVPAIKARGSDPVPGKGPKGGMGSKSARAAEKAELWPGWEWLSEGYETAIALYAAAMPPICAAAVPDPAHPAPFTPESLLRHCAETLLYDAVISTPLPATVENQLADTLLAACMHPPAQPAVARGLLRQVPGVPALTLDVYRRWRTWREKLAGGRFAADLTLCLLLDDAPLDEPDNWQMQFLVASRQDPSQRLSLAVYWALDSAERAAVQQHFGAGFEKHVLLALGAAARIYPRLWEALETDRPTGFQLSLAEAYTFLKESAWVLEDAGFTVIVPAWWTPQGRRRAKIRLKTSAHPKKGSSAVNSGLLNLDSVVQFQYQIAIDGRPLTEAEWDELVHAKQPLVRFRGAWMELDREKLQELLAFWQKRQQEGDLSLQDLVRTAIETEDDLEWEHDDAVSEMLARLQEKTSLLPIEEPPGFQGTLRPYQRRGVAWLLYLERLGLNPCLADDMGLGKTVQVIAHLLIADAPPANAPTLLIAPTSVLGNWRKEIERFAPHLRTLVHQGSTRARTERTFQEACRAHDVVLTSFALARLDEALLRGVPWRRIVVDEAQNIKNPQSAQTRAILKLRTPHRVALTGTPVENRLRDLWSIFNFLNPGYLGKEAQFRRGFEIPIQRDNNAERSVLLKKLVEPFILRRVKTDRQIITDLPEKVEQKVYCTLTQEQASLYEAVVRDVDARIDATEGIERRGLILATLMRLKQICNHPAQFLQDNSAFLPERSHKLRRLAEMLEEAIENGDSLLIFTQFTEIGAALDRFVRHTLHCTTYYLHGGTSVTARDRMVAAFQEPDGDPAVFILSLRAGGVGLNLTRASHVFHFDRWWNPAVEDQATDRAFRIGQNQTVFVHKFVAMGTVEERIDALIEDKKRISSSIVGADESWLTELDSDTFKSLIALQHSAVVE